VKFPNIRQTKLLQAVFCQLVATVALFVGKADFSAWAQFSAMLFTLYGVAHVVDTHLQQGKQVKPEDITA
jgi:hypothetical protein